MNNEVRQALSTHLTNLENLEQVKQDCQSSQKALINLCENGGIGSHVVVAQGEAVLEVIITSIGVSVNKKPDSSFVNLND